MNPKSVLHIGVAWCFLARGLAVQAAAAPGDLPQGEPLAVESTALVPLDSESAVVIVGIKGSIQIASRDEKELRVVSRRTGNAGDDLPVGIWQDGSKLIVAPAPGQAREERLLMVEVPRSFAVSIATEDSDLNIDGIGGGVDVTGTNVKAMIRACPGAIDVELTDGTLGVHQSGDARVRLKSCPLKMSEMDGGVSVRADGNEVALQSLRGAVDLETQGSTVTLTGSEGAVRMKATGGTVQLKGLLNGGDLQLSGAPLRLETSKGDITVTSDASVEFSQTAASLHFDMYGGILRGSKNDGILEVRTRNTEVNVESIEKGMRVQGDGLKAKIVDVGGELYVETSVSDVNIDRAFDVDLRLDRGNVTLQRAAGSVKATVTGGDVQILDGAGTVQLDLDGGDAEVSWVSISADKDSVIVNKSGSVTLHFPPAATCRIEAKTRSGRIDTDMPTVKVNDDQSEAQGPVNNGQRPLVKVQAQHDIHILSGSSAPPPEE